MRFISISLVCVFATAMSPLISVAQQQTSEPRTEAAVIAADNSWLAAELKGDVGFLDMLLMPEYRSISPDGSVHDKAAILASAGKATPGRAAMIEKYLADHPVDMKVITIGDTAVLTFTAKTDAKHLVRSCDIFVYKDGHWHALYSQHSTAESM